MVVAVLGEGRSRIAVLVQLNAPAIEFDLVQPLLTARWRRWNDRSMRARPQSVGSPFWGISVYCSLVSIQNALRWSSTKAIEHSCFNARHFLRSNVRLGDASHR